MVTRIVSSSTGKFLSSFMSSEVSLRKEGMAFISGCNQKSTYCEIFSVGLSQEETIGRIPIGFLCNFFNIYRV